MNPTPFCRPGVLRTEQEQAAVHVRTSNVMSAARAGEIIDHTRPTAMKRLYCSVTEAAQMLGVHPNTLKRWIAHGLIKHINTRRPGTARGRVLIPRAALKPEALLAAGFSRNAPMPVAGQPTCVMRYEGRPMKDRPDANEVLKAMGL